MLSTAGSIVELLEGISIVLLAIGLVLVTVILRRSVRDKNKAVSGLASTLEELAKRFKDLEAGASQREKDVEAWKTSTLKWLREELEKLRLANEASVRKVADALETISVSRATMAKSFGDFVALLRAAMRAEKALIDQVKPVSSGNESKSSDTLAGETLERPRDAVEVEGPPPPSTPQPLGQ